MATCIVTWELGEGMGHLTVFRPIVERLLEHGHEVVAVVRDVIRVRGALRRSEVRYFQAPVRMTLGPIVDAPVTYPQILANVGFGRVDELRALFEAWRNLYGAMRPDLIIFDHSPLGMLAARGSSARTLVVGTGFEIPPDESPLPNFMPWLCHDASVVARDEAMVLTHANQVLREAGERPLRQVSELFAACHGRVLATFLELDHYPDRVNGEHRGCWPNQGGQKPIWPTGDGPRVFAYLKPFPNIVKLLETFRDWELRAVVCFDGPHERIDKFFHSDVVPVTNQPFDLAAVGQSADLAIITGGHGSTASLLMSGVPLLVLPNHGEQEITARNVVRLGAGLVASPKNIQQIQTQLRRLLTQPQSFREAARRFAAKYAAHDATASINQITQLALNLIDCRHGDEGQDG